MDMSLSKLQELVTDREAMDGVLQSMGSQRVGHDWATELNWLMINVHILKFNIYYYTNTKEDISHFWDTRVANWNWWKEKEEELDSKRNIWLPQILTIYLSYR